MDGGGVLACYYQGIIIVIVLALSILFQVGLSMTLNPLLTCLPFNIEEGIETPKGPINSSDGESLERSFQHPATRSKQPGIWIPWDKLSVSDNEIKIVKTSHDTILMSN